MPLAIGFPGPAAFYEKIRDLIEADGADQHNPEKAAEIMEAAGYSRNDDGFWADSKWRGAQDRALESVTWLLEDVACWDCGR